MHCKPSTYLLCIAYKIVTVSQLLQSFQSHLVVCWASLRSYAALSDQTVVTMRNCLSTSRKHSRSLCRRTFAKAFNKLLAVQIANLLPRSQDSCLTLQKPQRLLRGWFCDVTSIQSQSFFLEDLLPSEKVTIMGLACWQARGAESRSLRMTSYQLERYNH